MEDLAQSRLLLTPTTSHAPGHESNCDDFALKARPRQSVNAVTTHIRINVRSWTERS